MGGAKPPRRAPASTQRRRATKPTAVATLAFIPSAYTSPAGVLARQRPGRAQALSGTPGVVAETAHQRHFCKRSAEVRALLAISAPTGAPSSECWLGRVLAGLPEVQDRVVTRRACMVHAWLVVCTRSGSRRRSSFRPRFAASPAHPGGCPTCAGHAAAVRPALRGHAGLWAGLAAKPAHWYERRWAWTVSCSTLRPPPGVGWGGVARGARDAHKVVSARARRRRRRRRRAAPPQAAPSRPP